MLLINSSEAAAIAAVTEITGTLTVNAPSLEHVSLPALQRVGGSISIQGNTNLVDFDFAALTQVGGDFILGGKKASNPSLAGLDHFTSIGGALAIEYNNALTTLEDLKALTSVGSYIRIDSNNALTSLTGLSHLTSVGGLSVNHNALLTSLTGLDAIAASIDGGLSIWGNPLLTSLAPLGSVTSIGEDLHIDNNALLTNLTGLDAITSIGGHVYIAKNSALTSVEALNALTFVGNGFTITDNPALCQTAVDALVAAIQAAGFTGSVATPGNGGTCPP